MLCGQIWRGLWLLWLQASEPALECAVVRLPRVAPGRLQVCPCQYLKHIGKGIAAPPHPSMTTRCMDGALVEPDNACQDFSGPTLSPQQVQQWRQAGYALLNGVLPQALVALVQQQARSAFTKLAKCQEPGDGLGFPFLNTAKHGQLDAASQVPLPPSARGCTRTNAAWPTLPARCSSTDTTCGTAGAPLCPRRAGSS